MMIEDGILIAGGYGVVGQQIANLIRQRHPDLPLIIAGRTLGKADSLAQRLGKASSFQLDVEQPNPLQGIRPRAIVAAVNDSHDYLLRDVVHSGIPYLDITRWSAQFRNTIAQLSVEELKVPVLLSSGWMGGVAAAISVAATRSLHQVDRIDISVLFSTKDKSGPNSVEYMDRLATPFEVTIDSKQREVLPYTDPRSVTFPKGYTTKVYRFDTPDLLTLPSTIGAKTVATRIAFDDAFSTNLLRVLTRSGIWKLISGARFTPLRQSLLYNPGSGASHEIVITASGTAGDGNPTIVNATIVDPQGQTHLTALGALVHLERLLGWDGAPPPAPGIVYPDTAPQVDSTLRVLSDFGVAVSIKSVPSL
ncbi:saccharopine dehydrogenase family protein [Acaryochloris marina]|uniref:saccharopine dehydrogenase family protein n=1 Tax=Acaryochloris marina TaxID=155978 RepID=UPI0021C494DC|nr:saccharopine dehydrogenase [Acaryochloris marina]BDM79763.1 hypothetical protein AM10699_26310 [Acaryochloris marina MBIC10699]